jgi:predicted alpha/beta-fold hydrolase
MACPSWAREPFNLTSACERSFRDAAHFYAMASSGPHLQAIRRPTLLLCSSDDPMIPAATIPREVGDNPHLHLVLTRGGGHVGFVSGRLHAPHFWGEAQLFAFLSRFTDARSKP